MSQDKVGQGHISRLSFFCLLNNLKRTDIEEIHIARVCVCVYIYIHMYIYIYICIYIYIKPHRLLKNGIIAPLCHISTLGFVRIRLIHCCFLFSKGHTLCLVIVNSSINVFNKLISFFLLWSILLPYRLSPVFIQLPSCFYLFLHLCFVNLQPIFTEFVAIRNAFDKLSIILIPLHGLIMHRRWASSWDSRQQISCISKLLPPCQWCSLEGMHFSL